MSEEKFELNKVVDVRVSSEIAEDTADITFNLGVTLMPVGLLDEAIELLPESVEGVGKGVLATFKAPLEEAIRQVYESKIRDAVNKEIV